MSTRTLQWTPTARPAARSSASEFPSLRRLSLQHLTPADVLGLARSKSRVTHVAFWKLDDAMARALLECDAPAIGIVDCFEAEASSALMTQLQQKLAVFACRTSLDDPRAKPPFEWTAPPYYRPFEWSLVANDAR